MQHMLDLVLQYEEVECYLFTFYYYLLLLVLFIYFIERGNGKSIFKFTGLRALRA